MYACVCVGACVCVCLSVCTYAYTTSDNSRKHQNMHTHLLLLNFHSFNTDNISRGQGVVKKVPLLSDVVFEGTVLLALTGLAEVT